MERDQYEEILVRLVTIALDITRCIAQQTQINDRLTTLIEHRPSSEAGAE